MDTTKHTNRPRRKATRWDKPLSCKLYLHPKDHASVIFTYCKLRDEIILRRLVWPFLNLISVRYWRFLECGEGNVCGN